jgi:type IV fimbrial biogenesis protein FimT
MQRKSFPSFQRGLTLIEICATLAIASILVGTAAPSFKSIQRKQQVVGSAAELLSDIHFARSEAVSRNEGVRISMRATADGATCVVVHTGSAADCSCVADGPAVCTGSAKEIKTQRYPAGGLQISTTGSSMRFDPVRGTATPAGTVRVASEDGRAVHHVVSAMGRVRSCSPGAALPGYKAC